MYAAYALRSQSTARLYIGSTSNFARRLEQYQHGGARDTRGRGPWEVVLVEEFASLAAAMQRERALKPGQGRTWVRSRLVEERRATP